MSQKSTDNYSNVKSKYLSKEHGLVSMTLNQQMQTRPAHIGKTNVYIIENKIQVGLLLSLSHHLKIAVLSLQ